LVIGCNGAGDEEHDRGGVGTVWAAGKRGEDKAAVGAEIGLVIEARASNASRGSGELASTLKDTGSGEDLKKGEIGDRRPRGGGNGGELPLPMSRRNGGE
jgi:hypothetical protein